MAARLALLLGAAQIVLAQNALVSVHSATPDSRAAMLVATIALAAIALAAIGLFAVTAIRRAAWRLVPAGAPGT